MNGRKSTELSQSSLYIETPKSGKGQKKAKLISKERFISQLFLRGDSGKLARTR